MWRAWVGLLLLATPVWAGGDATAYEALRVVGSEFGRDALHQIVSIRGTKGVRSRRSGKLLCKDPDGRVRELQIADGKIDSDNEADRDLSGFTEGATIDVSQLNLDSSGAYAVASHTAEASHTSFETADYTLRTDDRGEPTWIVTLRNRSSRPVGRIYIGGTQGTATRTKECSPVPLWRTSKATTIRKRGAAPSGARNDRSSIVLTGHRMKLAGCSSE